MKNWIIVSHIKGIKQMLRKYMEYPNKNDTFYGRYFVCEGFFEGTISKLGKNDFMFEFDSCRGRFGYSIKTSNTTDLIEKLENFIYHQDLGIYTLNEAKKLGYLK